MPQNSQRNPQPDVSEGDVARAAREGGDAEQRRQQAQDAASRMAMQQYKACPNCGWAPHPDSLQESVENASANEKEGGLGDTLKRYIGRGRISGKIQPKSEPNLPSQIIGGRG